MNNDFVTKLKSLQFSKVQTVTVKDRETGRVLGEQHKHLNGDVGATIRAEVTNVGTQQKG